MDGPPVLKRKRIVTACVECHRRKQKCDHGRPCGICVARKVPEKCMYDDGEDLGGSSEPPDPNLLHFTGQAGYSLNSDNNTYTTLQRSLLQGTDPHTPAKHPTTAPPRDAVLKDKFQQMLGQLPSMQLTKELIDNYFTEANWYFLVLERYYFDQLYKSWLESGDKVINNVPLMLQHFPPLLFQVLAVALQFLPLDSPCAKALLLEDLKAADNLSYKYSTIGAEFMQALGRHHSTVTSVQHDLMRSLWLKNCSRGTESWYSLGDAIKQAQDLGLHLQCPIQQSESIGVEKTLAKLWYDEYKRRLWITLFIWDSHMAFVLGRPRAINIHDCTIRTPLDCSIPEQPSKMIPTPTNASEVPSTYSAHLFHYFLARIIHEILSKGANKPFFSDYSLIQRLHEQVMSGLHSLPPAVRPDNPDTSWDSRYPRLLKQRQHISNAAQSFLVALHRPHINQHESSREAATQAAFSCLKAQQQLFDLVKEHQYRIYNLSFYTIDAGMFLSAILIEQTSVDRPFLDRTYMVLCEAIARLMFMKERSAMARSGLELLMHCCNRISVLHGIGADASTSISTSSESESQHGAQPLGLVQYVDPSSLNKTPQFSQVGSSTTYVNSDPVTHTTSVDCSNVSSGINPMNFGTAESTFTWNARFDALNDLRAEEPIGESMWRDLLG